MFEIKTNDEKMRIKFRIRQMQGEIQNYNQKLEKSTLRIDMRHSMESHVLDLKKQIAYLEKLVKSHYGKRPLPDCCYNHKKVEKALKGVPV